MGPENTYTFPQFGKIFFNFNDILRNFLTKLILRSVVHKEKVGVIVVKVRTSFLDQRGLEHKKNCLIIFGKS